jgi:7-cyano-7-deazaguanine reductase
MYPSRISISTLGSSFAKRSLRNGATPPGVVQYSSGAIMANYTEEHARAGIDAKLPPLETWPNQFPGYIITTKFPEYSSVCPKTGLPDFGTITIQYMPRKDCIELKALKMYLLAYRDLGIFYENAVNKILRDIVAAVQPEWCVVRGEFTPRGGLTTSIFSRWPASKDKKQTKSPARRTRR